LDVVERRELLQATAINFVGMSITGIIIPTVAGLVVQSTDIAWAYVMMGIAWALGPVTLIGLRGLLVVKKASSSPLQDFKQGVRYVFTTDSVRALIVMVFLGDFFGWGVEAMLPVMVRDVLGAGPAGVGYMFSAMSLGILVSTLVISNIGEITNKAVFMVAGYVGFGAFLVLFAVSPWLIVSLFLMSLVGLASGAAETTLETLLQTMVPDEMRGRVLSFRAFSIGASGLSGFYTGSIALLLGAPVAVAIGGGILVLNGVRMMKGISSRFSEHLPEGTH
jgi:MFS family permease